LPSGFKPAGTTTSTPTVTVTPTVTPTPVATVAASAAAAAKAAAANTAVSSNFNPGRFRIGEEADRVGTTINLTVTGAFDKEGTARTIIDTLNDSYYRGTGGATNLQIA
jgi:shikimate kinase